MYGARSWWMAESQRVLAETHAVKIEFVAHRPTPPRNLEKKIALPVKIDKRIALRRGFTGKS